MPPTSSKYILFTFLFSAMLAVATDAQQFISHLEIQKGASTDALKYMISDGDDNFYVGLKYGTFDESVIVGDTFVLSNRVDPYDFNLLLSDFYLLKLNNDFNLQGSFVIDNAEIIKDFYSTSTHTLITMILHDYSFQDSLYPITLSEGVTISRESNRGKGVLLVLDDSMDLEKILWPTTGEISQVAIKGNYAYLEIRIPEEKSYILLNQDTVFNHVYNSGSSSLYFQSIVLCKYDIVNESFVWSKLIGGEHNEELSNLELDNNGDIVIHGITSSGQFNFSDELTVENNHADKPFFAKYSDDGQFLWHQIRETQQAEWFYNMKIDGENNIYQIGQYCATEWPLEDTLLLNPKYNDVVPCRGVIVKYNAAGIFDWASQLEGDFRHSVLKDISFSLNDKVVVSGTFRDGILRLGESQYYDMGSTTRNAFLFTINQESGKYLDHFITEGMSSRSFDDLIVDKSGHLNSYFNLLVKPIFLDSICQYLIDKMDFY